MSHTLSHPAAGPNAINLVLQVCCYGFMARAGQQVVRDEARLEDRISIGVLAKVFPRHIIGGVVEATGVRDSVTDYCRRGWSRITCWDLQCSWTYTPLCQKLT